MFYFLTCQNIPSSSLFADSTFRVVYETMGDLTYKRVTVKLDAITSSLSHGAEAPPPESDFIVAEGSFSVNDKVAPCVDYLV
jgi:hypothetical protein